MIVRYEPLVFLAFVLMANTVGIQICFLKHHRTFVGWIVQDPVYTSIIPLSTRTTFYAVIVQVPPNLAGPYAFLGKVKNKPYRLRLLLNNIGIAAFIGIKAEGVLEVLNWDAGLKLSLVGEVCIIRSSLALRLGK